MTKTGNFCHFTIFYYYSSIV